MIIRRKITCICRRSDYYDAHERVEHICGEENGLPWKVTENMAIKQIQDKTHSYYVLIDGCEVETIIARHGNDQYLKTEMDTYSPDKLLNLKESYS